MADAGTRYTDAAQAELERRFRAVYREAQADIITKLDTHTKRLSAKDAAKRAQVEAGTLSQEAYQDWLNGQVFIGKQWKDKVDSVATSLLYANQQANDMIEGKKRAVFGENATFQAYCLEHDAGMDLSFSIYDSATVTRLIKEQPELLPRRVVNGVKDKAWNRTKIANAVAQGIIQGESIPEIAQRIAKQTSSSNMKAMTRYARTAMTGAQNAGRMEMLHEAQAMGIKVKKRWLATLDSRTRDAHRNLDGQVQDVDKPFESDLGPIDYPGDFYAEPANVYNCRCTLIYEYPEYMPQNAERRAYNEDRTESEIIPDMTYNEWKAWKMGAAQPQSQKVPIVKTIEYGNLFPEEAEQITRATLKNLNKEYPLTHELDYVGDVRTHRGLDQDVDILDLHYEYPNLTPCGAQYLSHGADGKSGACIEIHKESYSTRNLQDDFDARYELRIKYNDPMQPTKPEHAFYTVSDSLEGTIRHEYGHALSDDIGVFSGGQDNPFRKWQKEYWEMHRTELLSISQYAASHPDEMFAEAFVQAQDTKHPDTLAYKLAREIMDAFERYMRGEPL